MEDFNFSFKPSFSLTAYLKREVDMCVAHRSASPDLLHPHTLYSYDTWCAASTVMRRSRPS